MLVCVCTMVLNWQLHTCFFCLKGGKWGLNSFLMKDLSILNILRKIFLIRKRGALLFSGGALIKIFLTSTDG